MTCGTAQAYSREERAIVPLDEAGVYSDRVGTAWRVCVNTVIAGCTWLADTKDGRCFSCSLTRTRELFGDDTASYQDALDRRYAEGPPDGWEAQYISSYATMHPYEDFAETFAHYLHIVETIDNARQFGLTSTAPATSFTSFRDVVVGVWIPLSIALKQINRGMGKGELYPFVMPDSVIEKLQLIASVQSMVSSADRSSESRPASA